MINNSKIIKKEKALLIGVIHGSLDKPTVEEHLLELELLELG